MRFHILEKIIKDKAKALELNAAYSGAYNDGGKSLLLERLKDFRQSLVVKYDLRPSEYDRLNDIEVGEPSDFILEIEEYKIGLAKNIKH